MEYNRYNIDCLGLSQSEGRGKMKYSFDERIERRNTNSIKWDTAERSYGDKDIIPLWIADMDFKVPQEIVDAIKERADHGVFGYTRRSPESYASVIGWMKRRYNWEIEREWIKFAPGVVPGLNIIVQAYTKPGDEIIIQTPVYHPFYSIVKNNGCQIVENPLKCVKGKYEMDFENLKKIITKKTRMIILCSPHNPVGRVWTKEELIQLGNIALENNILVVVDEIHGDLVYKPNVHTVFASISEEFADNSIICTAPNKTFNIAALKTANIIIKNKKLRNQYALQFEKSFIEGPTVLGDIAQTAAYTQGEQWYEEMMKYVEDNLEFTLNFFKTRIPKIKIARPEGTYLLWLDCSGLHMNNEDLNNFFIKKCKVWFNNGATFGKAGENFVRLNIATSRGVLQEAYERIEREINILDGILEVRGFNPKDGEKIDIEMLYAHHR